MLQSQLQQWMHTVLYQKIVLMSPVSSVDRSSHSTMLLLQASFIDTILCVLPGHGQHPDPSRLIGPLFGTVEIGIDGPDHVPGTGAITEAAAGTGWIVDVTNVAITRTETGITAERMTGTETE